MRVIFMGTPEFSVPALRAIAARHEVVAVYSQPPRAAGRGQKPRPSPVQAAAEALGLAVRTPARLKSPEDQADFAALGADVAVVVAYGMILPKAILDAQQARGLDTTANLRSRLRSYVALMAPLLIGTLIATETRALALESRGFTREGERTYLLNVSDTAMDKTLRWLAVLTVVAVVGWRVWGVVA